MKQESHFNMPIRKNILVLIFGLLFQVQTHAHPQQKSSLHAHVHGQAQLQLAFDQSQAVLSFSSPLDNFLGFERAPKDEAEIAKLQQLRQQLQNPLHWIELSPAAQCQAGPIELDSPILTGKSKSEDEKKHGDLRFEVELYCKFPLQLRSLKANLLTQYKGIHRLKIEVVHPNGQLAKTLSADDNSMAW